MYTISGQNLLVRSILMVCKVERRRAVHAHARTHTHTLAPTCTHVSTNTCGRTHTHTVVHLRVHIKYHHLPSHHDILHRICFDAIELLLVAAILNELVGLDVSFHDVF